MSVVAEPLKSDVRSRATPLLAFIGTFSILLYYALRGGSYDIVVRQEEALVVWWVLALGWISGALPRYRAPRLSWIPIAALTALAAWTALSLNWTDSDERTLAEVARAFHYLGLVLLVWSLVGPGTWRAAAAGVFAAAFLVTALSVTSRLLPGFFPENRIRGVFGSNRLSYPFNYWNDVSAWVAMTLAIAFSLASHLRQRWVRGIVLALVPVCGLALYLTYSRQSILGALTAAAIAIGLSRSRWTTAFHVALGAACAAGVILVARAQPAIVNATGGAGGGKVAVALVIAGVACAAGGLAATHLGLDDVRVSRRVARVGVAATAVLIFLVLVGPGSGTVSDAWDQFRNSSGRTGSTTTDPAAHFTNLNGTRYQQWSTAVRAFRDAPLTGQGAGTFEFWWNRDGGQEFVRDAHSLYLETPAELGVPGLLLVLGSFGGLLAVALSRRRRIDDVPGLGVHTALLAVFVVFIVHAGVDWMWESTANSAFAFGGIALAGVGRPVGTAARRAWPVALRVAAGLGACAVLLVQVPGLAGTSLIRKSQDAFRAGDVLAASQYANDAVRAEPWAASPYLQRALVLEAADKLQSARNDLERAIVREPDNWRPQVLLARVAAEQGDVRGALRAYRVARHLRPASSFLRAG